MADIVSIELDTVYGENADGSDETIEQAIAYIVGDSGVKGEVTNPSGPGGGWPIVTYTGERAAVRKLAVETYHFPEVEVDEFLKPVAA